MEIDKTKNVPTWSNRKEEREKTTPWYCTHRRPDESSWPKHGPNDRHELGGIVDERDGRTAIEEQDVVEV